MIGFPNGKINLGLSVTRKREDGYHDIASCFYPIPWHDILEIIDATSLTFEVTGLPIPGRDEDNLVVKAYQLLKEKFDLPPVKIRLHKIIPMGAGLGGGSADASMTLQLLNNKFSLNLSNDFLKTLALKLGSDCPFFIENKAVFATGRGEKFESIAIDLSGYFLVIVHPNVHISTQEAYAGIQPAMPPETVAHILEKYPVDSWKSVLKNDFEATVFKKAPVIQQLKESLYNQGAIYASMSGSGSAVYGIFKEKPRLQIDDAQTFWMDKL